MRKTRPGMCRLGASHSPIFQLSKKVGQKAAMLEERVGNSIFCDLVLNSNSWSIGQSAPPKQNVEGVSAHHWTRPCHVSIDPVTEWLNDRILRKMTDRISTGMHPGIKETLVLEYHVK